MTSKGLGGSAPLQPTVPVERTNVQSSGILISDVLIIRAQERKTRQRRHSKSRYNASGLGHVIGWEGTLNPRSTMSPGLPFKLSGIFGLILLVLGAAFPAASQTHRATSAKPATSSARDAAAEGPIIKAIGSKGAPILMEVFSDYQCPSCRSLYEQTLRPLINDYVAAGKVYLVHRDYPLPMHKYSHDAARWINAAARIGKYPEVEAALYDNQAAWSADGNIQKFVAPVLSPPEMKRVEKMMEGCPSDTAEVKPAKLGGSANSSHGCALDAAIDEDVALGKQVPVQATPTFFFVCKGQRYPPASGVVSWPILRQFFDQLLKQ